MTQILLRKLKDWFQSGIIPKKSYVKLSLLDAYGENLEGLREDRVLKIDSEEIENFCENYSIEKEEGLKSLTITIPECQSVLMELIDGLDIHSEAIAFLNTKDKEIQLSLLEPATGEESHEAA